MCVHVCVEVSSLCVCVCVHQIIKYIYDPLLKRKHFFEPTSLFLCICSIHNWVSEVSHIDELNEKKNTVFYVCMCVCVQVIKM